MSDTGGNKWSGLEKAFDKYLEDYELDDGEVYHEPDNLERLLIKDAFMGFELISEMVNALEQVDRLYKEALPKFNWGASALDANAIDLLNTTGLRVTQILSTLKNAEA